MQIRICHLFVNSAHADRKAAKYWRIQDVDYTKLLGLLETERWIMPIYFWEH